MAEPLEIAADHLVGMAEVFVEVGAEERGSTLTPECTRWLAEQLVDQRRRALQAEHEARVAVERATTEYTRWLVLTGALEAERDRLAGLLSRALRRPPLWRRLLRRSS